MNPQKRNQNIDVLRAIAAFVVVFIHTPETSDDYSIHLFWLRFLPPANAIFAVLAGWFMVQSLEKYTSLSSAQSFFKDRFRRILVPYLVWSAIYVCVNCVEKILRHKPFTYDFASVSGWVSLIFEGGGATQLWFLVFLFYAQCLFCICYFSARNIKWVGLIILLLAISFSICRSFTNHDFFLGKFLFMSEYLFLGSCMLICGKIFLLRHQRCLFICSCLFICLHIVWICFNKTSPIKEVLPVLYVCAALSSPQLTIPRWVSNMGTFSMGIYVVHCLVIAFGTLVFSKISFWNGGHITLFCLTMVYFLISYGVVLVLRKTRLPGV